MKKDSISASLAFARSFLALSALVITMLASAHAATTSCMLETVAGNYAVATLGTISGGSESEVFLVTSDGNGNLSATGDESINGTIYSNVTATGTYTVSTVNTDCWFTSTTKDSLGNVLDIEGAIIDNGIKIVGLSTDASTELQYTAYRLQQTTCTLASHAGAFTVEFQALASPNGPALVNRQWTFNKTGSGSGSYVRNFGGSVSSGTSTGVNAINPNCTATLTITNSDGVVSHAFAVIGINQNGVADVSMETDSGWVSAGTVFQK
jgi:hypothetical protein